MAIAFVGSAQSTGPSITEPAISAGDTLILIAVNDGSNTAPSSPGNGYSVFWDNTAESLGAIFAVRRATNSTPLSLTVANATNVTIVAYSGAVDPIEVPTASLIYHGTGTTALNVELTLAATNSFVVAAKATRESAATASAETPPAGMTHRVTSGGTAELAMFDTNGNAGTTNWAPASQTISTGSTGWVTAAIELIPAAANSTVTVDAGSITIAGQNVVPGEIIPVANASVSVAGQDVVYTVTSSQVDAGAVTITGQDVYYTETTPVEAGSITITGQSVIESIVGTGDYTVSIIPAEIAIAGQEVLSTDVVAVDAAEIKIVGFAVTGTIFTPPPAVVPGSGGSMLSPRRPLASDDGVLSLQQILDRAFKQCRVVPQNISGEMLATGIEVLQDMLDALPARTSPLWARDHILMGLYPGAARMVMPGSSIDVLDMRRREWRQRHVGPLIDYDTMQTMELNGREEIAVVGIMFKSVGTYTFNIETSLDGTAFTVFKQISEMYCEPGVMYWFEAEPLLNVNYVRLNGIQREWLEELYLGQDPYDIPVDRVNQEDFSYLPPARQGPPQQFWVDRQASEPVVAVWPRPDASSIYQALHIHRQRHIDVSTNMRAAVEFPRRWKEAFISMLAYRIALNTPQIDLAVIPQLKPLADEMTMLISSEERDPAPISVNFGIRGYTR